ncbi:MAG: AraC family transcriptional regulator [Flavobacterium sp.]|nr:MAG: AraC family transcriptional regulator [Flavobacterium sp.]
MIIKESLFLKNMFSNNCVKLIKYVLGDKEGITILSIELGLLTIEYNDVIVSKEQITNWLEELGFGIIIDPNAEIVEKTKLAAFDLIFKSLNTSSLIRNSDYISDILQLPYDKISRVFSQVTGVKLEKYIILLKIEKVKEMLIENEYSLSEIAFMMDYSSVQYFSNQFKKIVGITITQYKESPQKYRVSIDSFI